KSTLLGIIAGLDDGGAGRVQLMGHDLTKMNEEERAKLRAQHVGFVFQSFMLIPTLHALENVQLPALLKGELEKQSHTRAVDLLNQLGLGE
ncbi:ATP-binding cassette domain-containing protein, partial [Proteus mirabilis]|uniref:ATP-binding cassette domain-containing protein n=1 Tax=Proteus mirabilis TaxID=584 RepID=UPI002576F752